MMTQGRIVEGENGVPDRLVYRMGKTGKRQSIKITLPASRILDLSPCAHPSLLQSLRDSFSVLLAAVERVLADAEGLGDLVLGQPLGGQALDFGRVKGNLSASHRRICYESAAVLP